MFKAVKIAAGLFLALVALGVLGFYMSVRAKELPPDSAGSYIRLEPGDEVLHAYTGVRWLDSQRYFVLKADPAAFEERIKKLSVPQPGADMRATVRTGAGKDLWTGGEPLPDWWDVKELPQATLVDVSSARHNHTGTASFFAKDRGLIYVVDR
jgi:hypothetical protein